MRANWLYPLSAWLVSVGEWRKWQRTLLAEVAGNRVLEIGCGRGWLLGDLLRESYSCIGLDLSPVMLKKASESNPAAPFVLGDGRCLPFKGASFDTVVMCFSGLCFTATALAEARRVLVPGGRLAVTELVSLTPKRPLEWCARFLWSLTETGKELPSAEALFEEAGLKASSYWVKLGFAEVQVTVGEKVETPAI
ncbi:MAG: class I SAM-dependent methyltransferase [Dehalococcoidia bacterium]|nr:class I SAM-dependent methyltransferase [Dehalococcoidia bacterium]